VARTKSPGKPKVYKESAERDLDFAELRERLRRRRLAKTTAGAGQRVCWPIDNYVRVFKLLRDDVLQIRHRTVMLGFDPATKPAVKVIARGRGAMYRFGTPELGAFQSQFA